MEATAQSSKLIQYDKAMITIGKKNILEANESNNRLIFNESYVIIGDTIEAKEIYACYDLTVIGNVLSNEINIKGKLFVTGNIKVRNLKCESTIICNGMINADNIYVGEDLIADAIKCEILRGNGNVMIRSTADINKSFEVDSSFVAFEGVTGEGNFIASNAIVMDYFEFDGSVKGNVLELTTDRIYGTNPPSDLKSMNIFEVLDEVDEILDDTLDGINEMDEEELIKILDRLSSRNITGLKDIKYLFEKIVELSYLNKISNFRDYLIAIYAKKHLPIMLQAYETVSGVFDILLKQSKDKIEDMFYSALTIDEIAFSLHIIKNCKDDMNISYNSAADKIFSFIGLRYSTVKKVLMGA